MPDGDEFDWRKQAHDDFGSLGARVSGTERSISEVGERVDKLANATSAQFASVNRSILEVADKLSTKIDSSLTQRQTSWTAILSSTGAIGSVMVAVVIALGSAVISPIAKDLDKVSDRLAAVSDSTLEKSDFLTYRRETSDRLKADEDHSVSERQLAEMKDRVDERYRISAEAFQKRLDRVETRVDAIDSSLVKRPEIEASDKTLDGRLDALSARENATQAQLEGLFPAQEIIKELWSSLRELRGLHDPGK